MSDQQLTNAWSTLHGTRLFVRALNLVLGVPNSPDLAANVAFNEQNATGRDVSGIDVDFHVEKSLKPTEPNTCSLKIYNLAEDTRKALSGNGSDHALTVKLEAGYVGAVSQLYFADVHHGWTTRDGATFVTHIESQDTIARPTGVRRTKKIQPGTLNGNIHRTMGARIPIDQAFDEISRQLGIGTGNLKQALQRRNNPKVSAINGAALIGNAARRMTDLCRSAGLEWSIQDGQLQLVNIAGALSNGDLAIEVSSDTGLWDNSPAVDSQGVVSVSTALIPGLAPGVLVNIDSLFVSGAYRVAKCRYIGSTRGNEWTCHFDAERF